MPLPQVIIAYPHLGQLSNFWPTSYLLYVWSSIYAFCIGLTQNFELRILMTEQLFRRNLRYWFTIKSSWWLSFQSGHRRYAVRCLLYIWRMTYTSGTSLIQNFELKILRVNRLFRHSLLYWFTVKSSRRHSFQSDNQRYAMRCLLISI